MNDRTAEKTKTFDQAKAPPPSAAATQKYVSDYPLLLKEWDDLKNENLSPQTIKHHSSIKVWWKCTKGHTWQASVKNRTAGSSCPVCSENRRAHKQQTKRLAASGSLAVNNPLLSAQWHPGKNGDLTPASVTPASNKKVWWQCASGHEWQASVADRNKRQTGCPYCSGRTVIPGVNDLATGSPALAAQWHPTLNASLKPCDVKAGSEKKVWWQCAQGHVWQAQIKARNAGNGCPVCNQINRKSDK